MKLSDGVKTYLEMEGSKKANILNALSYIKNELGPDSWVGFYIYRAEKDILELSLFEGTPACLIIEPSHGVVGSSFSKKEDIYVPDVHLFPGHIACDPKSRSEVVIYLKDNDGRIAIFDIDSPELDGLKESFAELKEASELFIPELPELFQ